MTLPIPILDDKTFEQLVEEAKRLIPVHAPEWTDYNFHDPGITFIELFAWLAEMQLYSLDRITDRHRLKYLKLLGIEPHPPRPAAVDATFCGNGDLPAGTRVSGAAGREGEKIVFEIDKRIDVLPTELKRVIVCANYQFKDVFDFSKPNPNFFFAFGEDPKPGDAFYLGFDNLPPNKTLTMMVRLYEHDLPPIGEHGGEKLRFLPSQKVEWFYWEKSISGDQDWRPLELKRDKTLSLNRSGKLSFIVPPEIEPATAVDVGILSHPDETVSLFWLRCKVHAAGWEIPPRIERLLPNTVSATQRESISKEESWRSSGLPWQTFETRFRYLLEKSVRVEVEGDADEWSEVADFDSSRDVDKHFTVDYGKGSISFGDGINGFVPPRDAWLKVVSYRVGGGERGNVREATVTEVYGTSGYRVTNHFPASGGTDAETIAQAIERARRELKVQFSAVTLNDMKTIAEATPGLRVARAKAIPAEIENRVTVVVVPYSISKHAPPSPGFLNAVGRHLDRHRLITTDIEVTGPQYVEVFVNAAIMAKSGFSLADISRRCITALDSFLSPHAGENGEGGWPFGRPVFKSEVYALLDGVEGVDGVTSLSLSAAGGTGFVAYDNGNIVITPIALIYPGRHNIEVTALNRQCGEIK